MRQAYCLLKGLALVWAAFIFWGLSASAAEPKFPETHFKQLEFDSQPLPDPVGVLNSNPELKSWVDRLSRAKTANEAERLQNEITQKFFSSENKKKSLLLYARIRLHSLRLEEQISVLSQLLVSQTNPKNPVSKTWLPDQTRRQIELKRARLEIFKHDARVLLSSKDEAPPGMESENESYASYADMASSMGGGMVTLPDGSKALQTGIRQTEGRALRGGASEELEARMRKDPGFRGFFESHQQKAIDPRVDDQMMSLYESEVALREMSNMERTPEGFSHLLALESPHPEVNDIAERFNRKLRGGQFRQKEDSAIQTDPRLVNSADEFFKRITGKDLKAVSKAKAPLPNNVDLSAEFPRPLSQGKTLACVGFAVTSAMSRQIPGHPALSAEVAQKVMLVGARGRLHASDLSYVQDMAVSGTDAVGVLALRPVPTRSNTQKLASAAFQNINAIQGPRYYVKDYATYEGKIDANLLKNLVATGRTPIVYLKSDARQQGPNTEDWMRIEPDGNYQHAVVLVGYGKGERNPFDGAKTDYYIVRDSFTDVDGNKKVQHFKVSRNDFEGNAVALQDFTGVKEIRDTVDPPPEFLKPPPEFLKVLKKKLQSK